MKITTTINITTIYLEGRAVSRAIQSQPCIFINTNTDLEQECKIPPNRFVATLLKNLAKEEGKLSVTTTSTIYLKQEQFSECIFAPLDLTKYISSFFLK